MSGAAHPPAPSREREGESAGAHPPAPCSEREGESAGAPSEDWRARGLAHPAGRGWVAGGEGGATVNSPPLRGGLGGGGSDNADATPRPNLSPYAEEPERMGTADWTVFTPERQSAFLAQLADSGNVRLAARAAGVSPQTAYRARRRAVGLAAAWDAAVLAARPVAEAALEDRALNGWQEPVFYRGEEVGHRHRFDGRLLLAHLARLDRLAEQVAGRFAGGEAEALAALDAAIEAGARGGALPVPPPLANPQDRVPGVPSSAVEGSRVAETRTAEARRAAGAAPEEPCARCGGWCETPFVRLTPADCQWLGHRLGRMLDARPADWRRPDVAWPADIDEIHADALEMGVPEWWRLTSEAEFEQAMERQFGGPAGPARERQGGGETSAGEAAAGGEETGGEAAEG